MTEPTFADLWVEWLDKAATRLHICENESVMHESALEIVEDLHGAVLQTMGVACPKCSGRGNVVYGSTATWHGGMGGASMTTAVCDQCWGSGRTDHKGLDLRRVTSQIRSLEKGTSLRWFEQRIGVNLTTLREHFPKIAKKLRRARWGSDFWLHRCADVIADTLDEMVKEKEEEKND